MDTLHLGCKISPQLCKRLSAYKLRGVMFVQQVLELLTKTWCSSTEIRCHKREKKGIFGTDSVTDKNRTAQNVIIPFQFTNSNLAHTFWYNWSKVNLLLLWKRADMFLCHGALCSHAFQCCGHACSLALKCLLILCAMAWHTVHREKHLCALSHALCPYVAGMNSNVAIIQTRTSGPFVCCVFAESPGA